MQWPTHTPGCRHCLTLHGSTGRNQALAVTTAGCGRCTLPESVACRDNPSHSEFASVLYVTSAGKRRAERAWDWPRVHATAGTAIPEIRNAFPRFRLFHSMYMVPVYGARPGFYLQKTRGLLYGRGLLGTA